jgi:hypothetical protein
VQKRIYKCNGYRSRSKRCKKESTSVLAVVPGLKGAKKYTTRVMAVVPGLKGTKKETTHVKAVVPGSKGTNKLLHKGLY